MKTSAVILAAGRGARMGDVAKALLEVGGVSFIEMIAATLEAAEIETRIVVVGPPHGELVAPLARAVGFEVVDNLDPGRGMASSVALGFARLAEGESALLWPVDTPRVSAETITALVSRASADRVVVPTFGGRGGHPVVVGRSLWPALVNCTAGKEGARSVFRHNRDRVDRVPVEDQFVVRDVDRPGDLADLAGKT